jgi:hypothetical protein
MNTPTLLLAALLAAPAAASFAQTEAPAANAPQRESPIRLGPKTADGFDDPAHLHFFRYQVFLKRGGLDGLDAAAWKGLSAAERAARIKSGEEWLKDKFSALMAAPSLAPADSALLAAVWGKDVLAAAATVGRALRIGDPAQIRAARAKAAGLVKSVGGANVDWSAIFDGAAPGAVVAAELPEPLSVKKQTGFLASLDSQEVRAPLASKATFVEYLQKRVDKKQVAEDALPGLAAMYEVLSRAKEPERGETAHLLPTVVRFLNDGKKIADEDLAGALAFAVPGEYDAPEKVGITDAVRSSDPVFVGLTLSHEFQHIYDMYAGRYYTLDSELRGFKTEVMYLGVMKKDPQMAKKLGELMNSDDNPSRAGFQDEASVVAAYAAGPQAFAETVAFGHHYNKYEGGTFEGRLTVREAVNPETGLQRQISAQNSLLARAHAESEALQKRLARARAQPSSQSADKELEKATSDLAAVQMREIELRRDAAVSTLRLNRMKRERDWMDRRAAAAGRSAPAYDLSLPVSKDYVVSGD